MKKSVDELEGLLEFKKTLLKVKNEQVMGLSTARVLDAMPSHMANEMPISLKMMTSTMKRISLGTLEIIEEELKAVDVEIASYNDAFMNAETPETK